MKTLTRALLMLAALCAPLSLAGCATQRDCGCVKPPIAPAEQPADQQEGT